MPRPPTHREFVIALRLLGRYDLSYAEALRQLVPVAARLGLPRPSYSTVRRLMIGHAKRSTRVAALFAVSCAAAGATVSETVRLAGRRAPRRRRAIPLRE